MPQAAELADIDIVQPMNIDSTNMRPADWQAIGDAILAQYEDYDGFVVLHGTDTMAYTAAALSYLIQDSPRPIVLTGSQQPMGSPFTDARINLYQSVLYATDPDSHDVAVVFGGKVVAGTRARKQRTMSFNAFTSVNYPELALIRNDRIIRTAPAGSGDVHTTSEPHVYHDLDERVFVLKLIPGIDAGIFDDLKAHYRALVIESFGVGGLPCYGDESFFHAVRDWVQSGRVIVMTTQVPHEGSDMEVYQVGHRAKRELGLIEAYSMTSEAVVTKLMWILGQTDDYAQICRLFRTPVQKDQIY